MPSKTGNSEKDAVSPRVTENLRTGKPIHVKQSGQNTQADMLANKSALKDQSQKKGGSWPTKG